MYIRSKRYRDKTSHQRQDASRLTTSRPRSASSALDFRSRATPETHLDFSTGGAPGTSNCSTGSVKPPRSKGQSLASSRDSQQRGRTGNHTPQGEKSLAPREVADGKVCLHTHHHHYWIISDSTLLPQKSPGLRSSKERRPIQQANKNSRFDGTMDSWPSEGEVEALAEVQRPPSANTNQRYLIAG